MGESKLIGEAEYIIRQYYKVVPDASPIDEHYRNIWTEDEHGKMRKVNGHDTWIQGQIARFHRMFKAIVANEEALQTVYQYEVLKEHSYESDEQFDFTASHFGSNVEFLDILLRLSKFFEQEDRDWLADLKRQDDEQNFIRAKRQNMDDDDDDDEHQVDVYLQTEVLQNCFKVESVGWNMGEHVH